MANQDSPFGLRPVNTQSGQSYGQISYYYVPATYGTQLKIGDAVVKTGTTNTTDVGSYKPGQLPEIKKVAAGAGNAITGVIESISLPNENYTTSDRIYPANTELVVGVNDSYDQVFEIQATTIAATDVGANANLTDNATTGDYSGFEVDGTSYGTGTTLQLKVLRLAQNNVQSDNELGDFAKVLVTINNHTEAPKANGI